MVAGTEPRDQQAQNRRWHSYMTVFQSVEALLETGQTKSASRKTARSYKFSYQLISVAAIKNLTT